MKLLENLKEFKNLLKIENSFYFNYSNNFFLDRFSKKKIIDNLSDSAYYFLMILLI